jgi:hypothetical protein
MLRAHQFLTRMLIAQRTYQFLTRMLSARISFLMRMLRVYKMNL